MSNQYIEVTITPTTINKKSSWEDVFSNKLGPLYGYHKDVEESSVKETLAKILSENFKGTEGKTFTNYEWIFPIYIDYLQDKKPEYIEDNKDTIQKYEDEINQLKSNSEGAAEIIYKYGVVQILQLAIPYEKVTQDFAILMGENIFIPTQINSLYNKGREKIELDEKYVPSREGLISSNLNTSLEVLIFSKAKKKLLKLTNYISHINISVSEVGGNFNISLKFINESDLEEERSFTNSNINKYPNRIPKMQSILRENDLIFIRFEPLRIEEDKKGISDKMWDMIGLIDSVNSSVTPQEISFSISGRDLIKALVDDENIFIPYKFANSESVAFGGSSGKIYKRLFTTGKYNIDFVYSLRSIEAIFGFVISQLSNIEVLTEEGMDWLKGEYGDKLSKEFTYNQEGKIESKKPIDGILSLLNFAVDEKVAHYRVCDASIASPDGSPYMILDKSCSKPFVELISDTFGNKYSMIARRPPWDLDGILNSTMIEVDSTVVFSENLSMENEVFSIYHYKPRGAMLGGNSSLPLTYLPMIVLDEYVKIWGNKIFESTSNYIDINSFSQTLEGVEKSPKNTFIEDYVWLVEVMAYLPFTRRGEITIRGDRRIKRGSWIYYRQTNEIFYVNAVANALSVSGGNLNRTTTLSVSRGMVKDFVIGNIEAKNKESLGGEEYLSYKKGENKGVVNDYTPGYFNLISKDYLLDTLKNNLINVENSYSIERKVKDKKTEEMVTTESVVVKDVFDFFLEGKQFSDEYMESFRERTLSPKVEMGRDIIQRIR